MKKIRSLLFFMFCIFIIQCTKSEFNTPFKQIDSPVFSIPNQDEASKCSNNVCAGYINVAISSPNSGAVIYYTTDGSNPSKENGSLYQNPLPIIETTTLKAIAVKEDYQSSEISIAFYEIQVIGQVNFLPGTVFPDGSMQLGMSVSPADAQVRYSISPSPLPSCSSGTVYSGAVTINPEDTVSVIACKAGWKSSPVSNYYYSGKVEAPVVDSQTAGVCDGDNNCNNDVTISLKTATFGANVKYTSDGTSPNCSSSPDFPSSLTVSSSQTIKAIACKAYLNDSEILSLTYNMKVGAPTINLDDSVEYHSNPTFSINSSVTSGATVYYALNSSVNCSSTLYPGPFAISSNQTSISVLACKDGYQASDVVSKTYTLKSSVPQFSISVGNYGTNQNLSFSSSEAVDAIYYTTDGSAVNIPLTCGSDGSGSTVKYSSPISIASSQTVKAVSCKNGYANSAVISNTYTMRASSPQFSITGGTYSSIQTVSISTTDPVDAIYYTSDGSAVSVPAVCGNAGSGSTVKYSSAITIDSTQTIRATSCKSAYQNSSTVSQSYTISLNTVVTPVVNHNISNQTVTLSSSTSGAAIYYTTNGSEPVIPATCGDNNGQLYGGAFSISWDSATTVKAKACKYNFNNSNTASSVLAPKVRAVSFNPGSGYLIDKMSITPLYVSMSTATSGAIIYYTTDGSNPGCGGSSGSTVTITQYNTWITVKAIACKAGFHSSEIVTATYYKRDITPPGNVSFQYSTYDPDWCELILYFNKPSDGDLSKLHIEYMVNHAGEEVVPWYVVFYGSHTHPDMHPTIKAVFPVHVHMGWDHNSNYCVRVKTEDYAGNRQATGVTACHHFN